MRAFPEFVLSGAFCYVPKVSQEPGPKKTQQDSDSPASKHDDTILIHGVSDDGESLAVLRAREDRVEAGVVRKAKEGQPVLGELLRLKPRPEFPLLCDVEVTLPGTTASAASDSERKLSHGGPAQVATASYRANWDAIWSKKKSSTLN